jgi:hypothetical protein
MILDVILHPEYPLMSVVNKMGLNKRAGAGAGAGGVGGGLRILNDECRRSVGPSIDNQAL